MNEFLWALAIIFQLEGGWTEIDGGTNYGIRAATLARANQLQIVQTRDIRKLSKREASAIYYQMYWKASGANRFKYPLNLAVFDAAVHMGPQEARSILLTALRKSSALKAQPIARQFVNERYKRLQALKKFPKYKKGWTRRMRTIAHYVANDRRRKK